MTTDQINKDDIAASLTMLYAFADDLDVPRCIRLLNKIEAHRERCSGEDDVALLDHAIALSCYAIGDLQYQIGRPVTAMHLASMGWDTCIAKDARRAALGVAPSPSSEAKWRLLGLAAKIKATQADEHLAGALIPPEQMQAAWLACDVALRGAVPRAIETSDPQWYASRLAERKAENALSLAEAGTWLCACCLRYAPTLCSAIMSQVNLWHIEHRGSTCLAPGVGHWRTRPREVPDSVLYLRYEILKHDICYRINGRPLPGHTLTPAEMIGLFERLFKVQKEDILIGDSLGLRTETSRWQQQLLQRLTPHRGFEVMEVG